jgi:ABC-type uncharacterized transport system fused permease/ATPase subunit
MVLGGLRDQLIYPDPAPSSYSELLYKKLEIILRKVDLDHLLEQMNGDWDKVMNWEDILSLGEQQRIAMARMFYHCPRVAIMDECTSALDVPLEHKMYSICRELGIRYIRYITHTLSS